MTVLNLRGKGGSMFLEPGIYMVHIFEIKDNDKTPKPSIDIIFKDGQGRTVKDMFSLTEKAFWRIANLAIAAGCASDPDDSRLENFDTNDLIGKSVMVQVAKEDKYSVVKSFWAVDGDAKSLIDNLKKNPGPKSNPAMESEPPDNDPF